MLRSTPRFERRLVFTRTVLAHEDLTGCTLRQAFRHINLNHIVLKETFDTVEAFEMFLSRHRGKVLEQDGSESAIPSNFDDGMPNPSPSFGSQHVLRTDGDALDEGISHFDGRYREEEAEARAYRDRILPELTSHYDRKLLEDPEFRQTVLRYWIDHHAL